MLLICYRIPFRATLEGQRPRKSFQDLAADPKLRYSGLCVPPTPPGHCSPRGIALLPTFPPLLPCSSTRTRPSLFHSNHPPFIIAILHSALSFSSSNHPLSPSPFFTLLFLLLATAHPSLSPFFTLLFLLFLLFLLLVLCCVALLPLIPSLHFHPTHPL